jgi:hypothetical protein
VVCFFCFSKPSTDSKANCGASAGALELETEGTGTTGGGIESMGGGMVLSSPIESPGMLGEANPSPAAAAALEDFLVFLGADKTLR